MKRSASDALPPRRKIAFSLALVALEFLQTSSVLHQEQEFEKSGPSAVRFIY